MWGFSEFAVCIRLHLFLKQSGSAWLTHPRGSAQTDYGVTGLSALLSDSGNPNTREETLAGRSAQHYWVIIQVGNPAPGGGEVLATPSPGHTGSGVPHFRWGDGSSEAGQKPASLPWTTHCWAWTPFYSSGGFALSCPNTDKACFSCASKTKWNFKECFGDQLRADSITIHVGGCWLWRLTDETHRPQCLPCPTLGEAATLLGQWGLHSPAHLERSDWGFLVLLAACVRCIFIADVLSGGLCLPYWSSGALYLGSFQAKNHRALSGESETFLLDALIWLGYSGHTARGRSSLHGPLPTVPAFKLVMTLMP